MKTGDARSSVFDLVQNSDSSQSQVRFATRDGLIQSCFDFTQELKPNSLSYRSAVTISTESDEGEQVAVTNFGTEAKRPHTLPDGFAASKKIFGSI
jgi:hypothetical protein